MQSQDAKEVKSLNEAFWYILMPAWIIFLIWAVVKYIKSHRKIVIPVQDAASAAENTDQNGDLRAVASLLDELDRQLGAPLPEFRVQNISYFFDRLTYEAHDPGAVSSVTDQVLRHYGLDPSMVQIETLYSDRPRENGQEVRGQFQNAAADHGKIRIILTPEDSEFDTVVAIIMHECAHYFGEIHHTKLDDDAQNERLTDITAIWLGAGTRMERGCFPRANVQIGYLTRNECRYAIDETERRRQAAIAKSESLRPMFMAEAAAQTAAINMADRLLDMEVLCGDENQGKLQSLKECCRHRRKQISSTLKQLEYVMSESSCCGMTTELLQAAQKTRAELEPVFRAFEAFRALTMDSLLINSATYAYFATVCEYAQSGNVFSQFEMLQFYNAHPSPIASEEAKFLIDRLEKSDAADAHYLLGRCWNDGICVPQDQNAAIRCWVQAAGLGSEKAELALHGLYKSQAQIENKMQPSDSASISS